MNTQEVTPKLCECGCGLPAPIAKKSHKRSGHIKGQPVRFIKGHSVSKYMDAVSPNPSGLCMCGCGKPTAIAKHNDPRNGIRDGQPYRFLHGHGNMKRPPKPKPMVTRKRPSPEERFWAKVDKRGPAECWLWTGSKQGHGYGSFNNRAGPKVAHRFSYVLHNGSIPGDMCVLHNCPGGDNPACVNPAHLWLGTQLDNIADMQAKGRFRAVAPRAKGEKRQRRHPKKSTRQPHISGDKSRR